MALLRSPEGIEVYTEDVAAFPGWEVVDAGAQPPAPCAYRDCGPVHKEKVHAAKLAEALAIKASRGEGLLAREAERLGIGLEELADQVIAKNQAMIDFEIERRAAVLAARNSTTT